MNKKVLLCLIILSCIVLILGLHGGSEYYFRDFCVHKMLNMFYNNGSPDFFKKPGFVSDLQAIVYLIFYSFLKLNNIVGNFDDFVRYFSLNYIPTNKGNISFMFPALCVNNMFAVIGVCFTFLTTYLLTNKKIFPSLVAGFVLATSSVWMILSHHLAVDIPLAALCIVVIFYSIFFIQNKEKYTRKELLILGVLCGLCTATKYNGLLIAIAPISVLIYTQRNKRDLLFDILLFVFGLFFAFFVTNPYIFFNFNVFKNDFSYEFYHAFTSGHVANDSNFPIIFHIFHSFPNAIGTIQYLFAIFGAILLIRDKNIPNKHILVIIPFFLLFLMLLNKSSLVFLRYVLPIVPIMAIFIGYMVYYIIEKSSFNNILKRFVFAGIMLLLILNGCNTVHFYKIMSTKDTRIGIKNIFKTLNISKKDKVFYTDIFSNPYYNEDFINQFPKLKDNIVLYLYGTNYTSINLTPRVDSKIFENYSIIIFDSSTLDRNILVRCDNKYAKIENQYSFYYPLTVGNFSIQQPTREFFIAQVNPYKISKTEVPFDILRSDIKYRISRGPFVEIYFADKNLRNEFVAHCKNYSLRCKSLDMEDGYYYINYVKK